MVQTRPFPYPGVKPLPWDSCQPNLAITIIGCSGVMLGMRTPLLVPPSHIWRPLPPQEGVLLNVSFKIKSRQNSENDGKILKKTYISSLKRVLLLVLQLSFPKNVPHFRAILHAPPPWNGASCCAGSAGPIVTPLQGFNYWTMSSIIEQCHHVFFV